MTELKYPQQLANILLVEDDEDDYILTRGHLEDLSSLTSQLTWVRNPEDGLQHLLEGKYDVCLLDYQLGAETGLSLLQRAIAAGVSTPIIMLTGQPDKKLDLQALEYGAADFLVKGELHEPRFARSIRYALSRREYELERINRLRLEADNRSKDRFLAHLSHELRTPLSSILGYTELLLETEFAQKAAPELHIILNNGQHLLSLLNDVLDLSKITANKLELRSELYNLASLIMDVHSLLAVTAIDKGLILSFKVLNALPKQVHLDGTRLKQILINLIHNAIKFTDKGFINVDIWLEQEQLYFRITDTGIGIPSVKIKEIFSPFMQIEDVLKRKTGGAGLGLAIAAELIQHMQGKIEVSSVENQGSVFTFYISPGDISSERLTFDFTLPACHRVSRPKQPSLKGRVLIVDDLPELRKLAGHWVQGMGAEVEFAADGMGAINKVQSNMQQNKYYQLILMDLHMPVIDGRDAVVAIRALGYKWPIVALTAATGKGLKSELTELGFTDLLSKPINKLKLYQLLATHLNLNDAKLTSPRKKPVRFLVVEDDIDVAELMQMFLQHEQAEVRLAHSAAECLAILAQDQQFSQVLLDLGLPDNNDLSLAFQIKQHYPNLPLVIVSGAEPDPAELAALDITQVLLKPVSRQDLVALVNAYSV